MDTPNTPAPTPEVTQIVTSTTPPPIASSNYLSQALQILELIRDGKTVAEAGQALRISRGTAFNRLKLIEEDTDRGVVKLLQANGLRFAEDWVRASEEAAKKGDHRPAKDALLHARAIEPVAGDNNQGARVAIIIGTPEQPIRVTAPTQDVVVEASARE